MHFLVNWSFVTLPQREVDTVVKREEEKLSWVLLTLLLLTVRSVQARLHTQAANCLHSPDKTQPFSGSPNSPPRASLFFCRLQHFAVSDLG